MGSSIMVPVKALPTPGPCPLGVPEVLPVAHASTCFKVFVPEYTSGAYRQMNIKQKQRALLRQALHQCMNLSIDLRAGTK